MPSWRWTITDPGTGITETFLMNPDAGGSPSRKRTFTYQATAGVGGTTLVFEGRPEVQTLEFSGTLLTEAQYEFLDGCLDKANQVLLVDDLGRSFWVVFSEFSPTRVRAAHSPWKHTYTLRAIIVDVA